MKFLISMSDVEDEWDTLPPEERERIGRCHEEFQRELGDRYVCCYGMNRAARRRPCASTPTAAFTVTSATPRREQEARGRASTSSRRTPSRRPIEMGRKRRFRPGPNEVREIREGLTRRAY